MAGGWPEFLEGAVTAAGSIARVPPLEGDAVTVPRWPNPVPGDDADPAGVPVCPFNALLVKAESDAADEGRPEAAPGEAFEPAADADAEDGVMFAHHLGRQLGPGPTGRHDDDQA